LAIELARRAAEPSEWPGLGRRALGPLRLILVPDARRLDSLTVDFPSWGAAAALPSERAILLRADTKDLFRTLRHELAHLALHQAVRVRVPLWFDEGYASWAAGEWDRLSSLELNLAVVRGAVPDLRSLDGTLRGAVSTADASYALAASAVAELAERSPSKSLGPLLNRLSNGSDFEASVLATTGLTLPQFEALWRRDLRQRYSLANWLIAGGGWGVLTLIIWVLMRRRKILDRPRRAALDEGWDVPPEDVASSELDRT
jgi:hypothetical protein